MNHHLFKVIFSKTLGQLTVVSEHTTASGKTASESTGSAWGYHFAINPLSFVLMLTMGTATIIPAHAQVISDQSATGNQQPTILSTASGVTQINIQTPSAAGVSMNQYSQFDINAGGAILNNARTNVNTQTAGMVQGNPWLATGGARVIVNQVNSVNPSYLNGYIEVAGNKAEVIIANPRGINVDGGGFINASRTTLTTGAPIINGGSLEGYRVTQGQVTVDGKGLDTSQSDYTDILARSTAVNAGIWAQQLKVTAGANQIDAAGAATALSPPSSVISPQYAIDTAALGGMYANKIILVGTEQGLGINNAGQIAASAGNVQIDANGQLSNSGTISSNGADNTTQINTSKVTNSGTISSQGNNHINATTVQNSGTFAAGRELKASATDIDNTNGIINGQRIEVNASTLNNSSGKIQKTGTQALALQTGGISNTNGGLIGYEPVTSTGETGGSTGETTTPTAPTETPPSTATGGGTSTVVQPEPVTLADGAINITGQVNNNAGQITANGGIDLDSSNGLTNAGTLSLNKLTVTGEQLDNTGGTITSTQAVIKTNAITNTAGKFGSSGNIDLAASSLTNSKGQITAGGTLTSNISGVVLNDDGTIGSAGEQILNAGSIHNTSGTIASTAAGLTVQSNAINNTNGAIQSATTTKVSSTAFDNTDGTINGASTTVHTQTNTLNNTRGSITGDSTTINSGTLTNDGGLIQGTNATSINTNGQTLTNTNSGTTGGIVSGGTLDVQAGDLNNSAGYISSTKASTIKTNAIDNSNGIINSGAQFDLTASSLTNTSGQVTATGKFNAAIAQTVANDKGTIASNDALTLAAATVNNANGQIASAKSSATVTSTNALNNTKGSIQAATTATVTGNGIDNTEGSINAVTTQVNSQNAALTNTRGTIVGDSTTIDSGVLTNDEGLIQGTNATSINTHGQALTNSNSGTTGGITSGGTLDIQSGDLANTAGYIGSGKATTITAVQLNNSGHISSSDTASITATGVDNRGGTIETAGNASISVGSGTVNNDSSLIRSGGTTSITAANLINTNTNTTDKGIEGASVTINTHTIDNSTGAIRADDTLNITSSGTLNNSNGLMSSAKVIAVKDPNATKTLAVTNTGGTIIAGQSNTIDAQSLTGDGKVLSNQNLTIALTDDFTNTATVQAANNLSLTSAGTINNASKLIAGNTNTVSANAISNTVVGEISGSTTQVKATETVTNRGLIDGGDTLVTGNTINNIGTGRIYGTHLAIGATTVNNLAENDTTATIAARDGGLDIGAQTINNIGGGKVGQHSLIFSGGYMDMGGGLDANNHATGKAVSVYNGSSTLESLGDMRINTAHLNNSNEHFTSQLVQLSSVNHEEYQNPGDPTHYDVSEVTFGRTSKGGTKITAPFDAEDYTRYNYTVINSETQVATSDPARILVGGSLTLLGDDFINDKSHIIVGQTIQGAADNLKNREAEGQFVVDTVNRVSEYHTVESCGTFGRRHCDEWHGQNRAADDHQSTAIVLPVALRQENTAPTSTGLDIGTATSNTLTDGATGAGNADVNAPQTVYVSTGDITFQDGQLVNADPNQVSLIKTGTINTNMPNSSLFSINPNNAGYLIETDPQFTSYKNWLSSDYMLSSLNLDPANMHKRLGDGFYEQKLVKEQIAQLTGRRYLNGQSNDDDQYKALMAAGVTFAGQYNLRAGIALTPEQMARLTSDIVWLVEQEVTLPNGSKTTALVPKVYVAVKPNDIDGNGTLISADSINLNLKGDLNNSGTMSGRTVTQITAENLNNLGGRINGNQVDLTARQDLNNLGGTIDADTSTSLRAGRDVNIGSTTATSSTGNVGIDRVAGLYVGNGTNQTSTTLLITAGRDANLTAADIRNDGMGSSVVVAGNNLNLATIQVKEQAHYLGNANNYNKESNSTDVGSNIQGTGNITLQAGNDLNATAANVNSDTGNVIAKAGHDVNIQAGQQTNSTAFAAQYSDKGLLSSSNTTLSKSLEQTSSIGSNFTGNQVLVGAGNDANIQGSNLVSDSLTWIDAKNNLNITAATNTESTSSFSEVKKSGLMGTGGIGFMVGKTQNSLDTDATATTHTASLIAANAGDVKLTAGQTLTVEGSDVLAANNALLLANNINIVNSTDTYTQSTEQKAKSSGLTVALAGTVGDAANGIVSTVQQANAASDRGNDRLNAAYNTKAALTAVQAGQSLYQDFTDTSDANKANQGNFIGVSVSVGTSKSQSNSTSTQTVANGSNIAAGNNLTVIATGDGSKGTDGFASDGDVNVVGSNLSGKTVNVGAARDVNFASAANTSTENSTNKSSSANLGVSLGVSASGSFGASVFANAAAGKGKAGGNGTTHLETQVTATDTLTIDAGRDLNLTGAQARGNNSMDVDVGRNLTITSLQDTNDYTSKQTSASAGVQVPIGTWTPSVNLGVNQQKATSTYASVNEQSGLYAGNGGSNINVAGHTQLNGGAIASTAPAELNHFSTGTLGFANIDNHAEYKATNSGINVGTGSLLTNALKNASAALPASGNQTGNVNSTTQSVISPANITIGGQTASDAQLAGLSRDAATANDTLKPIFDLQKVQDDMALGQVVGEIGAQATKITVTALERDAYVQLDHALAANEANPTPRNSDSQAYANASPEAQKAYVTAIVNNDPTATAQAIDQMEREGAYGTLAQAQQTYTDAQNQYGIGSGFNAAAQGLTGLASGIAGGNLNQGLSSAVQPLLAQGVGAYFDAQVAAAKASGMSADEIATQVTQLEIGRGLAHAAVGASVAYASGNNAGAGALGGVSGEVMAKIVIETQYGGKDPSLLTQQEKENVRAIATLASGLVGGAAGGNFENAAIAANAGFNAAVNNALLLEASFVARHPKIALAIGSVVDAGSVKEPNISTIASTFQLNIFDKKSYPDSGEGSTPNAFRHLMWQSLIAQEFGVEIAKEAGFVHESFFYPREDLGIGGYSSLSQADEVADRENNKLAQQQSSALSKSCIGVCLAAHTLDVMYKNGYNVVERRADGRYVVVEKKLSQTEYLNGYTKINKLDNTGAGSLVQQKRGAL